MPLLLQRGNHEPPDETVPANQKDAHRNSLTNHNVRTKYSMLRQARLLPLSHRTNQSIRYQAEPEIYHHPQVHVKRAVAGNGRKRSGDGEVDYISQHHREQRL
jgi:hypothetical protein